MKRLLLMALKAQRHRESGFTLIELLVVIIIAGVLISILVGALRAKGGSPGQNYQALAEANLSEYASKANLTAISCVSRDTDYNGYISCDAQNSAGVIVPLECGYGWNSGCKARLPGQRSD